MFSIQFDSPGGVEALHLRQTAVPAPVAGDVLIRTEASAINPADIKIRSGAIVPRAGTAPFTLGYDLVGTVADRGTDTDAFELGDRVVAMSAMASSGVGTWSEFVCLPETSVARAPDGHKAAALASLPLAGLTALQAVERLHLPVGSDVIVVGAAGAVGRFAVQLLPLYGYRAHALVRRPERRAALPLDSEFVIDLESAAEHSADGLIDTAGIDASHLVRPGGHYVSVVPGAVPDETSPTMVDKSATLVITRESGVQLERLVHLIDVGDVTLPESVVFDFGEFRRAHQEFDRRPGRRVALVR